MKWIPKLTTLFKKIISYFYTNFQVDEIDRKEKLAFSLLIFLFLIYGCVLFIPLADTLFKGKLFVLAIMGGSSAFYFLITAATHEKILCLCSFFMSCSCYSIAVTNVNFSLFLLLLNSLVLYFPMPLDVIFILLVVLRLFAFSELGVAFSYYGIDFSHFGISLLFQILFFFCWKNLNVKKHLSLYVQVYFHLNLLCFWLFSLSKMDLAKYIGLPLSGALLLFFLYEAKSGKDHFFSFLFSFINNLYCCFLFDSYEGAFNLLYLNLFAVFFFACLGVVKLKMENQSLSQFTSQFNFVVCKVKMGFFFIYTGIITFLFNSNTLIEEEMAQFFSLSPIFQVGFITLLIQFFAFCKEKNES